MSWTPVGSSSVPADNGSRVNTSPITITPPGGMIAGDLVHVVVHRGTNSTGVTNTITGGQSWTAEAFSLRSPDNYSRVFWCIFNGTWGASPQFTATGTTTASFTVVMTVYRWSGSNPITKDVNQAILDMAAPSSPFDVPITGLTTVRANALVLPIWGCSPGARTYALQTVDWLNPGSTQYRNTGGGDSTVATAYHVQVTPGPTGDVVNRQNAGSNSVMSIMAFAADPGGEPAVITGEALNYHSSQIILTQPGGNATTHHVYRSITSGFTPGASNKIRSDLGVAFNFIDEPLNDKTTYYYIVGAVSGAGESFSPQISVTTPSQLVLSLAFAGGAEFVHVEDEIAVEIQYQTTTNVDTTFTAPVNDVIQTADDRFRYVTTGLTEGSIYRTRARTRLSSGATFEAWSTVIVWTATSDTFETSSGSAFTSPPFGFPLRGAAAVLAWIASTTVTAVDISGDLGATWTPIAGFTQTGVTFDTTIYADGPYVVRVTIASGCAFFYHGGFLIDNANAATYEDDFFSSPRPAMAKYFSPSTVRYLPTVAILKGSTGHIGVSPVASFGPTSPIELTSCLDVIFMGECVAAGTGAGFQWDRTQAGELLEVGLVVLGATSGSIGVRVNVEHFFMTTALSPVGLNPRPLPDPGDPFRFVGVAQANENNRFEVVIGPLGSVPDSGWHKFSLPSTVGMSWTKMTLGGAGSRYISNGRLRPYQFLLWVTRPDPVGFPNRIRVRARLDGPDAWHCTGRRQMLIDQTVDVLQQPGAIPHVFNPGHIAFFTDKLSGNRSGDSGRFLLRYSAVILQQAEEPPTVPPPTDIPEDNPFVPIEDIECVEDTIKHPCIGPAGPTDCEDSEMADVVFKDISHA